jgi:hypothetical protein
MAAMNSGRSQKFGSFSMTKAGSPDWGDISCTPADCCALAMSSRYCRQPEYELNADVKKPSDLRTPSETIPPKPTARHFSSTTTRCARSNAARNAARGRSRRTIRLADVAVDPLDVTQYESMAADAGAVGQLKIFGGNVNVGGLTSGGVHGKRAQRGAERADTLDDLMALARCDHDYLVSETGRSAQLGINIGSNAATGGRVKSANVGNPHRPRSDGSDR